jgi:hypothetical protein
MTSVRCPHCQKVIASPAMLEAHIRDKHPAEVPAVKVDEAPPAASTNGLVWEEPPIARTKTAAEIAAITELVPELRRNPKRWARLYTWKTKQRASTIKTHLNVEALADIEFTARSMPDGTSALYGRFTGE